MTFTKHYPTKHKLILSLEIVEENGTKDKIVASDTHGAPVTELPFLVLLF